MRTRELLRKMDRTLDRIDEHMARGNEHMARGNQLMDEIREEHRLNREQHHREHELNRREHRFTRAAVENNTRVMRELLLQGEEHRKAIQRVEHGIQAQTEGLLHVLDELRNGRGGPGTAPAV